MRQAVSVYILTDFPVCMATTIYCSLHTHTHRDLHIDSPWSIYSEVPLYCNLLYSSINTHTHLTGSLIYCSVLACTHLVYCFVYCCVHTPLCKLLLAAVYIFNGHSLPISVVKFNCKLSPIIASESVKAWILTM